MTTPQEPESMVERVGEAIWKARQEAHGRWPDDGVLAAQPEQVRDWVRAEARAALEALKVPSEAMVAKGGPPGRGNRAIFTAMINTALSEEA
jgi:hypothetical protein